MLKLQTNNRQQHRSSLLLEQNSVHTDKYKDKYNQNKEMDLKAIEMIEKQDPSEETLKLSEIPKPGDYRYTHGQRKRYNPPRTQKAE